jgi:acyl-CoA thioesterase FadM
MFLRTALHLFLARRSPKIGVHDVARLRLRVMPADLDFLGHMNNGVYLSAMDLGRLDLLVRAGVWATFRRLGYYPVVANESISFRRSLQPWQRYVLETRIVGYDARAVYVEQRFVVDGEVFARAYVRGRFLKKSGGTVTMAELSDAVGVDTTALPPAEWLARWAADVAMPASKASAPSVWAD